MSQENGIWERRRSAIFKIQRMVKIKDKDKGKATQCKTIIIEEDPPPAPPAAGKTTCGCDRGFVSRRIGSCCWSSAVLHCARLGSVHRGSAFDSVLWVALLPGCLFFNEMLSPTAFAFPVKF